MAGQSPYEQQLREACRLVTERVRPLAAVPDVSPIPPGEGACGSDLVFQSRSGPPSQPWLEPEIRDFLRQLSAGGGTRDVVIVPIGFLAENFEVVYDLDVEVCELCEELGINMVRAAVVGSHPRFVRMIRELIEERIDPSAPRLALGSDRSLARRMPGRLLPSGAAVNPVPTGWHREFPTPKPSMDSVISLSMGYRRLAKRRCTRFRIDDLEVPS